jgi:type IV pilus assembly protein PilM
MTEIVAGQDSLKQDANDRLELQFGNDLICGSCGQENMSSRSFCGRCGQRLWETCPECQAPHRHGERFCGGCGADLERKLGERRRRCEALLQEAQQLREQQEYERAASRLQGLTRLEDARLQSFAEQAEGMLKEIAAERARGRQFAGQAWRQAEEHLKHRRYAEATTVLQRVPESLRDEKTVRLLAEAQSKRDEVEALTAGIQQALQAKALHELPGQIERLLELKPGHEMAVRLTSQLRERLLTAAQKKLAACEYAAAVKLLAQIPSSAADVEIEKLRDRARELDWLLEDLKLSPVADPPLLGLAERLVRLSPDDVQAQRLAAELRSRFEASPSDRRSAALPWAPPRTYRFGFPVHALLGLQRIACSAAAEAEWRKSPGRFFVACGLALQGLDRAAISINLRPSPKTSLLRKLTLLKRTSPTAAWGLDLGTTGLRAAHLTYDRQRSAVILDAVQTIEYRRSLTTVPDEAEQRQLKKEALVQFAARNQLEGERICLSVSGIQTLGRFVDLPPVEPKKLEETIRREAGFQFPLALEELAWGYQLLPRPADAASETTPYPVVLQAVKQYVVDNLVHLGEEAGLRVDVVQSECLALHNLAVYEFFGDDQAAATQSPVAVLDVGADITNLVISSPSRAWFRSITAGGVTFTNVLVRPFKLTREQAELLKREPHRARRVYQMYDLLEPDLTHLAEEVERSLAAFRRQVPGHAVQRMVGVGGGFQLHGLLRHLCRP